MKEEIRELILKALKENPEVFPSSTQIAELIENKYGMKISESTIQLNIELSSLQKKWIEECEDREFLENFSNKSLNNVEGEVKEARDRRFKEIVNKVLGENKEVFPGSPQIAKLIENKYVEYGVKISGATILRNIELSSLQKKWIEECEDREFLENFSNKSLNNVEGEVKEARDRRFKEIVNKVLGENKEVFPGSPQIAELIENKYGVKIGASTILMNIELSSLQKEWIEKCEEGVFLENFSKGVLSKVEGEVKEARDRRFKEIVDKVLGENKKVFPGSPQIAELIENKYGVDISEKTIRRNIELSSLQKKWVEECEDEEFLENFSKGVLNNVEGEGKEARDRRFKEIVNKVLGENKEVFPSSPQIAELIENKYGVKIGGATICRNIELSSLQKEWVEKCEDREFLENFSKGVLSNVEGEVKEAVDKRMYTIILSHIDNPYEIPVSRSTIERYIQKFPDLAFLIAVKEEQKLTLDQRIVLAMHVWKETRSPELHRLIGERLVQLWGFREMVALAKAGICRDGQVISMFHESMPDKLLEFVEGSKIKHFFVDSLRNGEFKAEEGKEVLLLSFMHWLTEKQAAEILLRLNRAVGNNNVIFITSPKGVEYADEIIKIFQEFGFALEKVGSFYLIPPESEKEQNKLYTESSILRIRKTGEPNDPPEEVGLFKKEETAKGGERVQPKREIVSYDDESLRKANPTIIMRDPQDVFVEKELKIKEIIADPRKGIEGALIILEDEIYIGFNMDLKSPYSVEIEAKNRNIPKSVENAILGLISGRAKLFEVEDGMKERYKEFVEMIREKKQDISKIEKREFRRKA